MDPSTKLDEWTTECALSLLMFEININNDFDPSEEYNGAYVVGRSWSALRADVNAILQMLMLDARCAEVELAKRSPCFCF